MSILVFDEGYKERIWGGRRLESRFGKQLPTDAPIGEAWLIADHPEHVSAVARGPAKGHTLRDLMETRPDWLLGSRAKPTPHGRFPLLLKLLDAEDKLSIQVHPDDALAEKLGEPDAGKTEMWHVLDADKNAQLYCGLNPGVTREEFQQALDAGTTAETLSRFPAEPGTTAFVAAGTVHAIGGGILLAEIQQNSDITYRLDDWGRTDARGNPRELHIEKGMEVTAFGAEHHGAADTLVYSTESARIEVLGACRYFAGERIRLTARPCTRSLRGESPSLLLVVSDEVQIEAGDNVRLRPGEACLIPGAEKQFVITGPGEVLHYYVPDLRRDIAEPLLGSGASKVSIAGLGGDPDTSDLGRMLG